MKWKLPIGALLLIGTVALLSLSGWARERALGAWRGLRSHAAKHAGADPRVADSEFSWDRAKRGAAWDGTVSIADDQARAIDLRVEKVRPQVEPIRLEVNGITAYDLNTQSQIRPRFISLIEKVFVETGQSVKQGDALLDVFSADLARAKSDYEVKLAQWEHDQKDLTRADELIKNGSISEKEYFDIKNDEIKSRAESKAARDQLQVLGLTLEEIAQVKDQDGTQKAEMIIRAPASGVVIKREAVVGNRYDQNDVLLVIAPLDHLWVWGNVYPGDAGRVEIGYQWEVTVGFVGRSMRSKIESITSEIDRDTKTVRIRTTIPNDDRRIKAEMHVTGFVEIPPKPDRTVIPRQAMITADGADYVFVRRSDGRDGFARFDRRQIRHAYEYADKVVVSSGLRPGERVAARGSLLLAQIYEDEATKSGLAPNRPEPAEAEQAQQ